MSFSDDDSNLSSLGHMDLFAPWKEAFGDRVLTCSPVRKGVTICMDMTCTLHEMHGGKKGGHAMHAKATPLEMVVINSFTGIDPKEVAGSNEFVGWTQNEIHFACYGTDIIEETEKRMFDNLAMREKLKTYVSLFEGAGEMFRQCDDIMKEDSAAAILHCVKMWSGAMNPLIFLWGMKGRNDKMASKIVRLKNTVAIWKEEADKAKRETAQLKWKIKMLKKTG